MDAATQVSWKEVETSQGSVRWDLHKEEGDTGRERAGPAGKVPACLFVSGPSILTSQLGKSEP